MKENNFGGGLCAAISKVGPLKKMNRWLKSGPARLNGLIRYSLFGSSSVCRAAKHMRCSALFALL